MTTRTAVGTGGGASRGGDGDYPIDAASATAAAPARRTTQCGIRLVTGTLLSGRIEKKPPGGGAYWRKDAAPYGRYTVAVHHYRNWAGPPRTPVEVAVLVDGKVERFQPVVAFGQGPQVVTTFIRPLPDRHP